MFCKYCGKYVETEENVCEQCKAQQSQNLQSIQPKEKTKPKKVGLVVGIVGFSLSTMSSILFLAMMIIFVWGMHAAASGGLGIFLLSLPFLFILVAYAFFVTLALAVAGIALGTFAIIRAAVTRGAILKRKILALVFGSLAIVMSFASFVMVHYLMPIIIN